MPDALPESVTRFFYSCHFVFNAAAEGKKDFCFSAITAAAQGHSLELMLWLLLHILATPRFPVSVLFAYLLAVCCH